MTDRSIWVSQLQAPLMGSRIRDHFTRFGEIRDIFIPSTQGDSCLILFASEESALTSLSYDQSCFEGKRIRVNEPTLTQLHWYQDSSTRSSVRTSQSSDLETITSMIGNMPDRDIATLMEKLAQEGQTRFTQPPSQPVESNTPGSNVTESKTPWQQSPLPFSYSGAPTSYMEQPMVYGVEQQNQSPVQQNFPPYSGAYGTSHHNVPPTMGHLREHHHVPMSHQSYPLPYFPPAPMQSPRIVFFSGDSGKSDHGSYQQWRHEVQCLINERQPQASILQAIRCSLKGAAAEALLN